MLIGIVIGFIAGVLTGVMTLSILISSKEADAATEREKARRNETDKRV